jgi:hypothetical protein
MQAFQESVHFGQHIRFRQKDVHPFRRRVAEIT